jgi:DNA-binding CsgD family transcriptional regulator
MLDHDTRSAGSASGAAPASSSVSSAALPNAQERALSLLAGLTERERKVFDLAVAGRRPPEVAAALDISDKAVKNLRAVVRSALGARTDADFVRIAAVAGLAISLPTGVSRCAPRRAQGGAQPSAQDPRSMPLEARFAALAPREREVFELVAKGYTTAQAADELGISPKTAEAHRQACREKLDAHTVAQFIAFAEAVGVDVGSPLPPGESATKLLGRLAHRERQVFELTAEGKTGAEVAKELGISIKTVESHALRASAKLCGVKRSGFAAVARAAVREAAATAQAEGAAS